MDLEKLFAAINRVVVWVNRLIVNIDRLLADVIRIAEKVAFLLIRAYLVAMVSVVLVTLAVFIGSDVCRNLPRCPLTRTAADHRVGHESEMNDAKPQPSTQTAP